MKGSAPYWHLDVFAADRFSGNQAAVLMLDGWPPEAVLQAIGEENRFAETAFLVPDATGAADFELRWFTPAVEVRLCGHATLASGHAILSQDTTRDRVSFRTRRAGLLAVRRVGQACEVALPAIATQPTELPRAVAALGSSPLETWRNADGYSLFLFANEAQVRALSPDFKALADLMGDEQFICTAPGKDTDVVSRVFVPGAGVDEDSATGSAHAVLAPFWAERLGRDRFTAHQASRRGGHLACRLEGERVWLEGNCVLVAEGRYFL